MAVFENIAPATVFGVDTSERVADVIDALPPHAQKIAERIQEQDRNIAGAREANRLERERLRERRDDLLREIQRYEVVPKYAPEKQAARWYAETDKIKLKIDEIASVTWPNRFAFAQIQKWAIQLPSIVNFEPVPVELPKGDHANALEKCLAARADFLEQRRAIDAAPLTIDEARAAMRAEIEKLVGRGRPRVGALFRRHANVSGRRSQGSIRWLGQFESHEDSTMRLNDTLALVVWANRAAIEKTLDAMLVDAAPENGRPLEGRSEEIAEIDGILEKLEREEGALVAALEADPKINVLRRHDLSVEAALGVRVVVPKPISLEEIKSAWGAFRAKAGYDAANAVLKKFRIDTEGDLNCVEPDERAAFLEACAT
ncbi:MAG: hypothetical protein AB7V61_15995 [Methylocystis sp.]